MIKRLMNNELERIWKDAVVTKFKAFAWVADESHEKSQGSQTEKRY
jgi:hypothetical protein